MKKAIFITCPLMRTDYYKLDSNDFGKVLNTRDNDLPKTDGCARIEFPLMQLQQSVNINVIDFTAKELDGEIFDGKMVFELSAGEYIIR